jgi:hypothetical protein
MARKPQFYGWTLLAVVFSLDFVNVGFPRLRRYGPGAYIPALNGQRGFTPTDNRGRSCLWFRER